MNDTMNSFTLSSTARLASGSAIPRFGLGVYQSRGQECYEAVREALRAGYRHVDSAQMYRNEELVGKAIIDSGIPRSEVFLTTKYNPSRSVRSAQEVYPDLLKSLPLLDSGKDKGYIDLMMIHAPWGGPQGRKNNWEALAKAQKEGWIKDIGVSNFGIKHLEALPSPRPALNQIEIHPWCQRRKIVEYCQKNGIAIEAYSPLSQAHPQRFKEPKLLRICEKHKKEQAQVLLRWGLQKGYIVIPKSVTASRIRSNAQLYDFQLDSDDMAALDSLDLGDAGAVCWNPVDAE